MFRFSLSTLLFVKAGVAVYVMLFLAIIEDTPWKKILAGTMLGVLVLIKLRHEQAKARRATMAQEREGAKSSA